MSTTLAKVKRNGPSTETALDALLVSRQWGFADDTRRISVMQADGVTIRRYWDASRLADQTSTYGTALIGTEGITGVTPYGGSIGASSSLQAMLKGLASANANYIANGTGLQSSSNFNISGSGSIGTDLTVGGDLKRTAAGNLDIVTTTTGSGVSITPAYNGTITLDTNSADIVLTSDIDIDLTATGLINLTGATNVVGNTAITGTLSSSGVISATSGVSFTSNGTNAAGRIVKTSGGGLSLQGITGSTYDFSISSAAGYYVLTMLAGTNELTTLGPLTLASTLTLSSFSSGRIPYTTTAGLLTSGTGLTYNGSAFSVTGTADVSGNFAINTNKFNVTAASGNTAIAGTVTSSGDIEVTKSTAGVVSNVIATNTDNTNGSSHARFQATSGGASGGDPYSRYTISGVLDWSAGVDNSDGDAYVITPGATLGSTTNALKITTAGAVTIPGTLGVTGATTLTGNVAMAGRLNINGATDNSNYYINGFQTNAAFCRSSGTGGNIQSFGVGVPGGSNLEYAGISHDGAANVDLGVYQTGTGSYRPLRILNGGAVAITVATNQGVQLASTLGVTGATTLTGDVTLNNDLTVNGITTVKNIIQYDDPSDFFLMNVNTGDVALSTNSGDVRFQPTGGHAVFESPTVPSAYNDTGTAGAFAWDTGFIYICVATNTWKRVAISTF